MINQISDLKLREVLNTVVTSPHQFENDEIISAVSNYTPSHSCNSAALRYVAIIAHIAFFREDLERSLLKIAVRPLYYYGISDPKAAVGWIQNNIKVTNIFSRQGDYVTTKFGKKWIENNLVKKQEMIGEIINEIIKEDEENPLVIL
ncbi:hypothetical protein [Cohnella silvisoli]|uniref:Uncharacterized protein n=1 Tax=Cohnella silvisoli TaxID=2873699 RepID=A0ABV1KZX2_9BACL|nr:hypothetical protein [Cohnella silvisoli]MCD9024959.1 hypothetical protein [Cohnella silvisoli]